MKNKNLIVKIAIGLIIFGLIFIVLGKLIGGKSTILKNGDEYIAYDNKGNRLIENSDLQEFKNINIDVNLDIIEIIKSNTNKIELDYNDKSGIVDYKIDNDTLTITQTSNTTIGFNVNFSNNKQQDILRVYVKDDVNLNKATINQDYGNINLNDISCNNIILITEDGNININNIQVFDTLKINNKYGNIDLIKSDIKDLIAYLEDGNLDISKVNTDYSEIKNKYGNIYAVDFVTKGILVNCDDGDIDLRGSFFGDSDINNKYGSVNIVCNQGEKSYDYSIVNKYGNINVNNEIFDNAVLKNNDSSNNLNITCDDGNIKIMFSK